MPMSPKQYHDEVTRLVSAISSGGGGGGGGSSVIWEQIIDSGTKIATIIINGTETDVFIPTTAKNAISYDYVEVNSQGIITDVVQEATDMIEIEFDFVNYNNNECIFSTTQSGGGANVHLTLFNGKYYCGNGAQEFNFGLATSGKHTFILNNENNECVFDDTVVLENYNIASPSGVKYTIGCRTSVNSNVFNGKLYKYKVTNKTTNEVKMELIPIEYPINTFILDGNEVTIYTRCLFDKVNKKEYYYSAWQIGND